MLKHVKKNIINTLTKRGLRLKAFKFMTKTISTLKKQKKKPLLTMTKCFLRIMPVSITRSMKRGKHEIFVLLPISIKCSFHMAANTLIKNSKLKKKKNTTFWENFISEMTATINRKSKSYQLRLKNVKDVKFVTSFGR